MSWEKWEKYESSVEDYLRLAENYEVRFEYWGGTIALGDGTPVILLGGVAPEGKRPDTALVVISDATEEEVEQLAAFVASLRQSPRREGE
ncbi:MAG: hypothetical protein JOZ18_18940 [Chloroflexi bacterium]|nr:hypothetical protein [Chloroflexota bacterium]